MAIVSFLETSNHDLALVAGNLVLCRDVRAITQHVEARLRFFLGEWFLDLREGVPYWEEVFVKNPDVSVVRTLLSRVITETPGVVDLTTAEFRFDPQERILYYTIEFSTDTGQTAELSNAFILGGG